ncbi:MAG: GCN5-related N-acetyltransferase [Solirubrobacterales bacterium]|nr:GCN5-related N-acetyltransferase [Solirubrobacterales bacterium]
MSVEVRRARNRAERRQALDLRHRVFCVEQGVPISDELDGRDDEGIHLVAVDPEGDVLGTCRLLFAGDAVQFSRLAVEPSHRRRGIASRLLDAADVEARAGGACRLVLHAQTYAKSLYVEHGYDERGHLFWEAGIEHVAMEKTLA